MAQIHVMSSIKGVNMVGASPPFSFPDSVFFGGLLQLSEAEEENITAARAGSEA